MSVSENVGVIMPKSTVATYEWHINDFCTVCKSVGDILYSPVFETCSEKCMKWKLQLYPKGNGIANKDCISLFLSYIGKDKMIVDVKLSILNIDNVAIIQKLGFNFDTSDSSKGYPRYATRAFITDEKNKLLVSDKLKVLCEITFVPIIDDPKLKTFNHKYLKNNNVLQYRLQEFDDLEELLLTGNHSDITFKVGKDRLKAHKAIVTSRSPVFAAMFDHDMKEKENNEIEVNDIKPDVMKEVLRFMYASKVTDIDKIASDLLPVAEKYSISDLKILCEKTLYEDLTIQNAVEYLKIADMYNTIKLKSKVIEFIIKNQKVLVDNPEFKSLMTSHPELFWEVFQAMTSK